VTDAELYAHFSNLIQTMPELHLYHEPWVDQGECEKWLARADALIETRNMVMDLSAFRRSVDEILTGQEYLCRSEATKMNMIILRAHAAMELKVSPSSPGGFIAVGSPFDAHKSLVGIFAEAQKMILIVDPYMDDKILTEFVLVAPKKIAIQLLSDSFYHKPAMKVASEKWVAQYGLDRPLFAKLTPARTLHDRLIVIDNQNVWNVSQSFKDLAARSPASIIKFDKDTAALKVAAYGKMWDDANPI
jgi:hypothetical protein